MTRFLVLFIACLWWQVSHAQTDGSIGSGNTTPRAVTANGKTTINWSQAGTALPSLPATAAGTAPANIGNLGIAKNGSQGLNVASKVSLPLPGAREAPIDVVGKIKPAKLVALAKIASKMVPLVQIATTLPELYDWFNDAGVEVNPAATGDNDAFLKADPSICTVAPCQQYRYGINQPQVIWSAWVGPAGRQAACQAAISMMAAAYPGDRKQFHSFNTSSGACYFTNQNGTVGPYSTGLETRTVAPAASNQTAQSFDQIAAQLEQNSPGPGIAREFLEHGLELPVEEVGVSGPASIPGPSSQATQPNGNQVTTNTTYNFNYAGNTVNVTSSTTTNIHNPTTGETTTSESQQEETVDLAVDTALPGIPALYTQKYPDGMSGVWTTKKNELMQTPLGQLTANLMPDLSGVGQCPVWTLPLDLGAWNFGSANVAPPCWIWDVAAVFIVIGALLLSRALIFGG